eukprot:gnl/TRDRNA2_/TRDRNA2_88780_c1_seq1.p1 gnl/TRDRNA2_/TRDRNA2_88780_c1~~gnl/TRDRNA2_/TRDRNA2_88780_c1_seq1.p1  ORF type:complete len:814 (+),score=182.97 gnl/TRDRNA2_/TRDRNA2_88780_c1_seq1:56-2443(+)
MAAVAAQQGWPDYSPARAMKRASSTGSVSMTAASVLRGVVRPRPLEPLTPAGSFGERPESRGSLTRTGSASGSRPRPSSRGFNHRSQSAASVAGDLAASFRPANAVPGTFVPTSVSTQAQNQRVEKVEAWIEQSNLTKAPTSAARSIATPHSEAAAHMEDLQMLIERNFEQDLKDTQQVLGEMGRSIRMERYVEEQKARQMEEKDKKRAEEARKRYEKERKLRDQAKEAQQPKRRVELKLEQRREFKAEAPQVKVPMQRVEVEGGKGRETISTVNVKMLQQQALGLNSEGNSGGFETLMMNFEEVEKTKRWENRAFPPERPRIDHIKLNSIDGGESIMSRCPGLLQASASIREEQRERREQRVRDNRHVAQRVKLAQKRQCMRSCWQPEGSMHSGISGLLAPPSWEITMKATEKRSGSQGAPDADAQKKERKISKVKRSTTKAEVAEKPKATTTIWWGVIRAVFHVVSLLDYVRRKHRAADVLRRFSAGAAGYYNMVRAMKRTNEQVKRVQIACKQFIARKNRWCEQQVKVWSQYEDNYLASHFATPAAASEQQDQELEKRQQPSTKQAWQSRSRPGSGQTPKSAADGEVEVDWRTFRIPEKERKFQLGFWYTIRLRKHVAQQMRWLEIIKMAKDHSQDMKSFLKCFGVDDHDSKMLATESLNLGSGQPLTRETFLRKLPFASMSTTDLLTFGEKEALELLVVAAQDLRQVKPFDNHPANQQEKSSGGTSGKESSAARRGGRRKSIATPDDENSKKVSVTSAPASDGDGRVDVDELFRMDGWWEKRRDEADDGQA